MSANKQQSQVQAQSEPDHGQDHGQDHGAEQRQPQCGPPVMQQQSRGNEQRQWQQQQWPMAAGPQWRDHPWQHHRWSSPDWHAKRRYFFLRFVGFFALIMTLIVGSVTFLAYHLTRHIGGDGQMTQLVWFGGCGLAAALPLLALALVVRVFRGYALPLADVMTAADRVANGDLDVRLDARGSREFQQLASSFNRMTTELARTDQQRRNLAADVAHELRTPLHIILGNLEGVLDGVYEPTSEHIAATLEETRQLARLVADLRTLSLAESGELPLHYSAINVVDLLADIVNSFTPQAEAQGITIQLCETSEHTIRIINGDPGRLDQVLSNLIVNALRHTPTGGMVQLSANDASSQTAALIAIAVRDTGQGIAAADLPFVFDRFWKGDRARTHAKGGGSGLGLAIARQLVEAHGGTIGVESIVGQGTTFIIRIPVQKEQQ